MLELSALRMPYGLFFSMLVSFKGQSISASLTQYCNNIEISCLWNILSC